MTPFEIPLSPNAQSFDVTLGDVNYLMRVVWNVAAQAWMLDISDTNGVALVQGIPLVTGVDLLGQYAYLGIKGSLIVSVDIGPVDAIPSFDDLGVNGRLYFVTVP